MNRDEGGDGGMRQAYNAKLTTVRSNQTDASTS